MPDVSKFHFDRLDPVINFTMGGNDQPIPNWNSNVTGLGFGPVAMSYTFTQKYLIVWLFRVVAPCTGNYTFRNLQADGMSCF